MVLLDAALAFVLTLAALATVVTILMETGLRAINLKKRDQVRMVKKLYESVISDKVGAAPPKGAGQWAFVKAVLENPMAGKELAEREDAQKFAFRRVPVFEDISVEHLLRRALEIPAIKQAYEGAREDVELKLALLAKKYDEYRSAISVEFKAKAQIWSLAVGVLLALATNIDGLAIFEGYLDEPAKRDLVIAKSDEILEGVSDAEEKLQEAMEQAVDQATMDELTAALGRLEEQNELLKDLGLPIGFGYFPHCWASELFPAEIKNETAERVTDPRCPLRGDGVSPAVGSTKVVTFDWPELLAWVLKAIGTGLLIGLGAPFWYDVARRLSEVRRSFGGSGSAAQRLSGSDGTAADASESDAQARGSLIDRIIEEVLGKKKDVPADADA